MTKKQSIQFFVLGIIYSALVSSLAEGNNYYLAHTLGFASLIYVVWTVLSVERKGYAK